jgi:hypothetical protein
MFDGYPVPSLFLQDRKVGFPLQQGDQDFALRGISFISGHNPILPIYGVLQLSLRP